MNARLPSLRDLPTRVTFENLTTNNVNGYTSSLLQVEEGSGVEVRNSYITNVFNLATGAVVSASESNSEIDIYHTTFEHNSAFEASLFKINLNSLLRLYECNIQHNFAVLSGVFYSENNGRFEFYDSAFYSNYGVNIYYGTLDLISVASNIDNCIFMGYQGTTVATVQNLVSDPSN